MKKHYWLGSCLLVLIIMLTSVISCFSQEKEIPITSNSKEAIQLFKEGRTLTENYEFSKGIKKYDEALKLDPDFALAYLYKAIRANDYDQRIENIEKALKLVDKVSEGEKNMILVQKALYDSNEGDMWNYLNKLLELYPNDKRVKLLAGNLNYGWEKYDKALTYFKKALEIDNQFTPVINLMGYTYMKLEQFDESEKYYKIYIDLLPNKANPYDSYADFLLSQDRYDESISYYKKAIEKDKSFNISLSRIGNIYIIKKDYNEARKYFQQFYDVSPDLISKFSALRNIANTYLYESNKEDAIKTYDDYKALAKENNSPYDEIMGNAFQGYIISCCGDPEKGLQNYEESIKMIEVANLTEDQRYELKMNAAMWKGHAYIEMKEFEKSKIELENCAKLAAKLNSTIMNNMVNLFSAYKDIKQKKYDQALNKLDNVTIKGSLLNYYYALAYDLKGDIEQSEKYYKKLINEKESNINLAMYYKKAEEKLLK